MGIATVVVLATMPAGAAAVPEGATSADTGNIMTSARKIITGTVVLGFSIRNIRDFSHWQMIELCVFSLLFHSMPGKASLDRKTSPDETHPPKQSCTVFC
jgi:hypothetical protein